MTSIFDLKTSVEELESLNEGISRFEYNQIPCTRDLTGNNFPNGQQHFRFECSGARWWIPSRTYMRARFQLQDGAGNAIDLSDNIAPNMSLMSNLYQNAEFRISDKVVSRVADFLPEVDALETRLTKSKSWLDSIGDATNWWESSQVIRRNEVSVDGTEVDVTQPPITNVTARVAMTFDAPGADANGWGYDDATGVLTYARGADAAGLTAAQAVGQYLVGSYFSFIGVAGVPETPLKITALNAGAGTMTVAAFSLGVNVALSGLNNFNRTVFSSNLNISKPTRRNGEFELCYVPPLSIFKVNTAMPSGRYQLSLQPQTATSYQKRAIESTLGIASKEPLLNGQVPDGTKFKLVVVDMYLYVATVEGPRADDITYLLSLEQTRAQVEKVDSASFQQRSYDVSPSTYALTCAFSDQRSGENTAISCSKFKSYDNDNIPTESQELKLNRFFIQFAGVSKPSPDSDPQFVAGTDYTIQRYNETMLYSGAHYDTGGSETIKEFHDRGQYLYFSWPRKNHCAKKQTLISVC